MNAIAQKLRSLINPAYAAQLGTESYERRVSAEEIERLELEVELLTAKIADCRDSVQEGLAGNELAWAVASTEGVAEYVKAAFKQLELEITAATLRIENDAQEIDELRAELKKCREYGEQVLQSSVMWHDHATKRTAQIAELLAELEKLKAAPITLEQIGMKSFAELWISYCDKKSECEDLHDELEKIKQQAPVAFACGSTYFINAEEKRNAAFSYLRAYTAPLYLAPGAQPEGMVLVPIEPTAAMIDATGVGESDMREMVVADYKAMLEAAKETK